MSGIQHAAGRDFPEERERAADIIRPAASGQSKVRLRVINHVIAGEIAGIIHADQNASGRMSGAFGEVKEMSVKAEIAGTGEYIVSRSAGKRMVPIRGDIPGHLKHTEIIDDREVQSGVGDPGPAGRGSCNRKMTDPADLF